MVARSTKQEIPQKFASIEEAGDFWDTHSLADFVNETREVSMTFELCKRVRYISVPEAVYQKISDRAHKQRRTIRDLVLALGTSP